MVRRHTLTDTTHSRIILLISISCSSILTIMSVRKHETAGPHVSLKQPSLPEIRRLLYREDQLAYFLTAVLFHDTDTASFHRRLEELKGAFGIGEDEIIGKFFLPPLREVKGIPLGALELKEGKPGKEEAFSLPMVEHDVETKAGKVHARVVGTPHKKGFTGSRKVFHVARGLMASVDGHESNFDRIFGVKSTRPRLDSPLDVMYHLSPDVEKSHTRLMFKGSWTTLTSRLRHPFKNPFDELVLKDGRIFVDTLVTKNLETVYGDMSAGGVVRPKEKGRWYLVVARSAEQAQSIQAISNMKAEADKTVECNFLVGALHVPLVKYFLEHPRERHLTLLQTANLTGFYDR